MSRTGRPSLWIHFLFKYNIFYLLTINTWKRLRVRVDSVALISVASIILDVFTNIHHLYQLLLNKTSHLQCVNSLSVLVKVKLQKHGCGLFTRLPPVIYCFVVYSLYSFLFTTVFTREFVNTRYPPRFQPPDIRERLPSRMLGN